MLEFEGKKAVITGATRGIGRAITVALLAKGATVVGLFAGNQAAAEAMRQDCAQHGDRLFLQQLDVSDFQAVSSFFAELEERWETLDILVNNAGIRRDAVLPMMKEEDWRRVIDVNLTGGYTTCKFAVPLMMKQKFGRILFVTSPMGHLGFAGQANYSASK
ncbi:MAG: SDR family NAD(P)-dependent oxidoreductase, partial [Desulfobulbus sp.]|nr:SDR family NAD(P)-dependent oxidoreductase [Desulfobulbus sp.]